MSKELKKYIPKEEHLKAFNAVISMIEEGASCREARDKYKLNAKTFHDICNYSPEYDKKYVRACVERGNAMAERAHKVIEDVPLILDVDGRKEQNNIGLAKAKAIAEQLKWHASKLNKALSDKADTNINIQNNAESVNVSLGSIDLSLKDDNM
jgi:hypothetical protein